MAETINITSRVIPGTYIGVRAEGLIGAGAVSTGNIGIVGTAASGTGITHNLSSYETALALLGASDAYNGGAGTLNLVRALEIMYRSGASISYARALSAGATPADFTAAFNELIKDDVNILIAPELSTANALAVLPPILESAENNGKDMIAVIGSDATVPTDIVAQVAADDRVIMAAPGIVTFDAAASADASLSGTYTAAAIAGRLSTLAPHISITNKVIPGVVQIAQRFAYGEVTQLISGGVLVLEQRQGIRVVRGVTTEMASNGPFRQITTRRIVDQAKAGIRSAADPFIGRLNNQRVRAALRGAIDGFLTTMLQAEALTGYSLEVTATRRDEIEGRAIVNAVLQPTFSIDFVAVTLVLQ